MKKSISFCAALVLLSLAVVAIWLSRQRTASPTHESPAATQQMDIKQAPERPSTPPNDSQKDDGLWKRDEAWKATPECKAFDAELTGILTNLEARQAQGQNAYSYLTSNEVAFVITYMQSSHPYERAKAVAAAGGIWSSDPAKPELLPYVARLLSDPVWQVRMWAANSLMLMRDKSVIPDLEPLLNDDRPEVARTAKEAISKLQQKETAPKDH